MKKAVAAAGDAARAAFARNGMMASSHRHPKSLHPTNLHVNRGMLPSDTVQSRLPDPDWLEHWPDRQISFGRQWESRLVTMDLHNLFQLFEARIASLQDLNRYRKQMAARLAPIGQAA
jgi:hypothetical protein